MKIVTSLGIGLYIVVAAFIGLSFGFADLGPGETEFIRILRMIGYFFVVGAIFGMITPERKNLGWVLAAGSIFTLVMTITGGVRYISNQELMYGVVGNLLAVVFAWGGAKIGAAARLRKSGK